MKRLFQWLVNLILIGLGLGVVVLFIGVGFWIVSPEEDKSSASSEDTDVAVENVEPEVESTIDQWIRGWSESQAASVRETCMENPDCDASRYEASAEPKTSFGWDGASEITKMSDWAEGRRYTAVANDRKLLFYLNDGNVASVYEVGPDSKEVVCKGPDCDVD